MKKLPLIFLITLFISVLPIQATKNNSVFNTSFGEVNVGLTKTTVTDGDRILSDSWSLEKLKQKKWVSNHIDDSVLSDKHINKLTRRKTDLTSTLDVEYINLDNSLKILAKASVEETGYYRLVWNIDGGEINETGSTYCIFDSGYMVDWSDVLHTIGEIYTVTETERGLAVTFLIGKLVKGETFILDPYVMDYYSETNYNVDYQLTTLHPSAGVVASAVGQSFNSTVTANLTSARFFMRKANLPTGNAVAVLYAHTGTFGTNGKPTGAALATSNNFDVSTLTGTYASITFTFAIPYELQSGVKYVMVVQAPGVGTINANDRLEVQGDNSSPGAEGNGCTYENGAWVSTTNDIVFYVVVTGTAAPENIDVLSDSTFNANIGSWVNVTVRNREFVADLNTVDIQVNTTGDVNNFTLRWTQATNTFSEVSDPDGICTLDSVNSTRINIDLVTDRICFRFIITGGQSGLCDVTLTSVDDGALSDVDVYLDEFTFTYFNWNTAVYNLIDSAFGQFGIFGYIQQTIVAVEAVAAQFTDSLTSLVLLINLQFQVVWQVWTFFSGWATRMITTALAIGTAMSNIMNGTTAGFTNLWNSFSFNTWIDVTPPFIVMFWVASMQKRGRTQGFFTVLYNDLNAFANVFAFFMGVFTGLIGFIEGKVNFLFQALTI